MLFSRRSRFLIALACLAALVSLSPHSVWAGGKTRRQPVSNFAEMDGHKLHYWTIGQEAQRALVFIHGWTCDASFWDGQLKELASGSYRVIALDLLGHGLSDKPKLDYSFDTFIRGIRAVLNSAGVTEAVLCGHSMGGSLARYMALKDGKGISGIILVDGAFGFPPTDAEARKKWREKKQEFTARFKRPGYRKAAQSFIFSIMGPSISPGLTVRIVEGMLKTPYRVALSSAQNFSDPDMWPGTPLKLPVLAVYAKSPHITHKFKKAMGAMFPAMEYREVTGMGHFFMMEKPDQLNMPVLDFLHKNKLLGQ